MKVRPFKYCKIHYHLLYKVCFVTSICISTFSTKAVPAETEYQFFCMWIYWTFLIFSDLKLYSFVLWNCFPFLIWYMLLIRILNYSIASKKWAAEILGWGNAITFRTAYKCKMKEHWITKSYPTFFCLWVCLCNLFSWLLIFLFLRFVTL